MTKLELELEVKELKVANKELKLELKESKKAHRESLLEKQNVEEEVNVLEHLRTSNKEITKNEHTLRREHNALKENFEKEEKKNTYLVGQLDGLTDLFNEVFTALKEQNALDAMSHKGNMYREEHLDRAIARFNQPATIPKTKGDDKK